MNVSYHRLVQRDFFEALDYYRRVASEKVANNFDRVLHEHLKRAAAHPARFHFERNGLRRVNLKGFPWHFLFRERRSDIFVLVLCHDKRHPDYGLNRE